MYENSKGADRRKRHPPDIWDENERRSPRRNSAEQAQPEEVDPNYRILHRRGEAKPPRPENVPIGMARCKECGALVPKSRLDEHIKKTHGEQEDVSLEKCPFCNANVRADRLEKHIRKLHPNE
jgi:hypothetical protein